MFYMCEIICGLEYIHDHDIIYRDLKLANILVDKQSHIKLADFGLSKHVPQARTSTPCGSLHIRPPEMVREEAYTCSVDIYALGVIFFQMMTGPRLQPFGKRKSWWIFALSEEYQFITTESL